MSSPSSISAPRRRIIPEPTIFPPVTGNLDLQALNDTLQQETRAYNTESFLATLRSSPVVKALQATLRPKMSTPKLCDDKDDFLARGISKLTSTVKAFNDYKDCPICYAPFGGKTTRNREDAVKIVNCGHVFGRKCLEIHVGMGEVGSRLCPMCRDPLWKAPSVVRSRQELLGGNSEWARQRIREDNERHRQMAAQMTVQLEQAMAARAAAAQRAANEGVAQVQGDNNPAQAGSVGAEGVQRRTQAVEASTGRGEELGAQELSYEEQQPTHPSSQFNGTTQVDMRPTPAPESQPAGATGFLTRLFSFSEVQAAQVSEQTAQLAEIERDLEAIMYPVAGPTTRSAPNNGTEEYLDALTMPGSFEQRQIA